MPVVVGLLYLAGRVAAFCNYVTTHEIKETMDSAIVALNPTRNRASKSDLL